MSIGRVLSSDAHKLRKSCESLIGICAGMMADGVLNKQEIQFLSLWLKENDDISSCYPGEIIAARVREVLNDGHITEDEIHYLEQTLRDLLGGTIQDTGAAGGLSTRLPVNDDIADPIRFNDAAFCFTGEFLFGTRAACERAIMHRGAMAFSDVRKNLDYLVIGTMASRDWANSSHGRKIEKAIDYQHKGASLLIVSEEHWIKYL